MNTQEKFQEGINHIERVKAYAQLNQEFKGDTKIAERAFKTVFFCTKGDGLPGPNSSLISEILKYEGELQGFDQSIFEIENWAVRDNTQYDWGSIIKLIEIAKFSFEDFFEEKYQEVFDQILSESAI